MTDSASNPAKIADYFLPKGKSAHNAASGDAAGCNASKPTLVRKAPKAQSVGCPVHGARQLCLALLNVSRIGSWGQGELWPWDAGKKVRNRSALEHWSDRPVDGVNDCLRGNMARGS